jgi:flagellar biosynthesis chaperone FliJ
MAKRFLNSLKSLEKLEKSRVEELRVLYFQLQERKEGCIERKSLLQEKIEKERALASENLEVASFFNNFEHQQEGIIQAIQEEIENFEDEITAVLEELTDHFKSQKNYEHLVKKLLERKAKEENLKEQQDMDEVSLRKFFFSE